MYNVPIANLSKSWTWTHCTTPTSLPCLPVSWLIVYFLAAVNPATSLQAWHNDRKLSINLGSSGSPVAAVAAVAYKQGFLQLRPIYPILLLTLVQPRAPSCCRSRTLLPVVVILSSRLLSVIVPHNRVKLSAIKYFCTFLFSDSIFLHKCHHFSLCREVMHQLFPVTAP